MYAKARIDSTSKAQAFHTKKAHSNNRKSSRLATSEDNIELKVWDIPTRKLISDLKGASRCKPQNSDPPIYDCVLAATSNGCMLACSYGKDVTLWNTRRANVLRKLPEPRAIPLSFSGEAKTLMNANTEREIKLRNVPNGKIVREFKWNVHAK